jgi:oligoendopeptidase F
MTATTRFGRQRRPRTLQARSRPDARDEAAPAVGRTGTLPARHSVVGATAWNKLFDETIAGLSFDVDGEKLGIEGTLNLLTEQDRAKREAGARANSPKLPRTSCRFARVHNTLAKEKESRRPLAQDADAAIRPPPRQPCGARGRGGAARRGRRRLPRSRHRYYELKRKWLGLDTLQVWDRNAPLPMEETRTVGWDEARKMVMEAYAGFDPRMADLAEPFFTKGWIDAGVKEGKAPGAFAHPTVTDVHPYVMLNYLGKPRDVMTLAHELGHGVHQVLAAVRASCCPPPPHAGRDRQCLRRDADLPQDAVDAPRHCSARCCSPARSRT